MFIDNGVSKSDVEYLKKIYYTDKDKFKTVMEELVNVDEEKDQDEQIKSKETPQWLLKGSQEEVFQKVKEQGFETIIINER